METKKLFLNDSYLKECDSKAVMVEFTDLTIDQTIFYPTSYGQQNDQGEIIVDGKKFQVIDVRDLARGKAKHLFLYWKFVFICIFDFYRYVA